MNLDTFKNELRTEIRRLSAALAALEDTGSSASTPQPTFTSTPSQPVAIRQQRTLSDATRKKISKSMKANWTRGRRKNNRELSPAIKAKIAASQKARWAKQKAAAQTVAATAAHPQTASAAA